MPPEVDADTEASRRRFFAFDAFASIYKSAFNKVMDSHAKARALNALPKEALSPDERKTLKKFKDNYQKEIKRELQKSYYGERKIALDNLAKMLEELKPHINFHNGALFTQDHPILCKYHLPYDLFIRESKHHKGEWRVEILDPTLLGEGSTGKVYNSLWALKVKPQGKEPIAAQSIYDIKESKKVIKSFAAREVVGLIADQNEAELESAQRFTGKGQSYLNETALQYYLILQKASGKPLNEKVGSTNALDYPSVLFLAYQLLASTASIHSQGWSHNDIKPDNIMVDARPNHLEAKLIDFSACTPFGFQQFSFLGSPIIFAAELITASRTNPYTIDATTDSASLAAALGVLFGCNPFVARQALLDDLTKNILDIQDPLAATPYDFSALFSRLADKPDAAEQAAIHAILDQLNASDRAERITAEQALEKLARLHPEFSTTLWQKLQTSFNQMLPALSKIPQLSTTLKQFENLAVRLDRFISKKIAGEAIQNPLSFYPQCIEEIIAIIKSGCDLASAQRPEIAMQWYQILLTHFDQSQFSRFFNSQALLTLRIQPLIDLSAKKLEQGLNPAHPFLINVIFLLQSEKQNARPLNPFIVTFLENHYRDSRFSIAQLFSALSVADQTLKNECLIQLLQSQSLTTQQKTELNTAILSAVTAATDPTAAAPETEEAMWLYSVLRTDSDAIVRQAIAQFATKASSAKRADHTASLLSPEQKQALAELRVMGMPSAPAMKPAEPAIAKPIQATHATADIPADVAAQRTARSAHILSRASMGLFSLPAATHFSTAPPPPPALPESQDHTHNPLPTTTTPVAM